MKEAALKTKWRQGAVKHGIWSKSMSPHQIPGCPDIIAVDVAASEIICDLKRTRHHWIEAKVADPGPKAFRIDRDATGPQVMWIRTMGMLGVSSWWLILDAQRWLLVPWDRNEVSREEFRRKGKKYGAPVVQLYEPEVKRNDMIIPMVRRLDRLKLEVARLFKSKKKTRLE